MHTTVDVAVPLPLPNPFTYLVPAEWKELPEPGRRVLVPFRKQHLVGMIVDSGREPPREGLKAALKLLDPEPLLPPALLQLGRWMSSYYFAPPGESLRVMLPPGLLSRQIPADAEAADVWPARRRKAVVEVAADAGADLPKAQKAAFQALRRQSLPVLLADLRKGAGTSYDTVRRLEARGLIRVEQIDVFRSPWLRPAAEEAVRHRLTDAQSRALEALRDGLGSGFCRRLLHGVTGSGKTELYLNLIEEVLDAGGSALMLVPEIGLTPQVAGQFRAWFRDRVAILHSGLSEGERFDQWRRIRERRARVVVGTRSAVFAPLADLKLIIVDEEHDGSYKQEETPRYNGRDVALKRAQLEGALVVLGSATPQLETYWRAEQSPSGALVELPVRILDRPLPEVSIVDMRVEFERQGRAAALSEELRTLIAHRLQKKQQALVLLNRRGWASSLLCRSCGHTATCPNCSITLTFHRQIARLLCHYCGSADAVPEVCPECGKRYLYYVGEGTEQIQELISEAFPAAEVDRLDRDAARRKQGPERILEAFRDGRTDILVGTQMIAKGHDFPNVTLVGVLAADQGLRLADFRAAERTFQLLTQVAGRAGRGAEPGRVVIQTYYPNHYSLKLACDQDYGSFYRHELRFRERFRYPPFTALASLLIRGREQAEVASAARRLARELLEARRRLSSSRRLRVLGPAPAALEKLRREFRFQILLKTSDRAELHEVIDAALAELGEKWLRKHAVVIDIDPLNLL